jgi:phosphatidylglycerol:prolipoprotein diacylglycerol transferase
MFELFPSRQIILSIGDISLRWYGLMYVLGFVAVYVLGRKLQKYRGLTLSDEAWLEIVLATALGIVVGGRLGYVLFYEPAYYARHIGEIFLLSRGGMSAHGGVIGAILALVGFVAKNNSLILSGWPDGGPPAGAQANRAPAGGAGGTGPASVMLLFFSLVDVLVVPAALGLAFGRVGNFINQEIYGTVTTLPWAAAIPHVSGLRHPWPLYEALTNLLLAAAAYLALRSKKLPAGVIAAGFLVAYSALRFFLEYIRQPEWPPVALGSAHFTLGQIYSLPFFLLGAFLILWRTKTKHPSTNSTTA